MWKSLPIYERCDALTVSGKTELVISVVIFCRKLNISITPSTLAEGEPVQQTNNSVAGMAAAVMAPKLALLETWPHVRDALTTLGRTWESMFVFANAHDPLSTGARAAAAAESASCVVRAS